MVAILTPIYEAEFLGFSYGFRPKRSQHQALDALALGGRWRINWVLDCDVQSFFDKVSQSWLIRFIEHRIGDRQNHPVDRQVADSRCARGRAPDRDGGGDATGCGHQPSLADIYLHYVYDLWATSGGSDAPRAT